MAKYQFNKKLNEMEQETEQALERVEQKVEKRSKSIIKRAADVIKQSIKNVTGSAEKETEIYATVVKNKFELEKGRLNGVEVLRKRGEEAERERQARIAEEYAKANQHRVYKYQQMIEREGELEESRYADSEALRGDYFTLGQEEWESYADYIYDICASSVQNLETEQKQALLSVFREVRGEIEKSYETLMKNQNSMENKLSDFGGLYSDAGKKTTKRFINYDDISLDNIKDSTEALLNYEHILTDAKKMLYTVFPTTGVSMSVKEKNKTYIKDFFAELAEMSVNEGAMFASYLVTLPAEQSEDYLKSWAQKQDLAKSIAEKLYSDDQAEIFEESAKSMSTAFTESLEKHFGYVPEGFYNKGVLSAQNFSNGFKEEMEKALSEISFNMANIFTTPGNFGTAISSPTSVVNNSSYNIYSSQPENVALEIYKYDEMKRMLTE